MRRPAPGGRIGHLALAALLVLDVVLVAAALQVGASDPVAAGALPARAPGASGSATGTAGPTTPTPGTAAPTPGTAAPLTRVVVAVSADTAWRYARGTCAAGGASLEITTDGGATWEPAETPFRATARVRVRPDGSAFAIGAATESCTLRFRGSAADGTTWGSPTPVTDAWYRGIADPRVVGTPSGGTSRPCGDRDVLDLGVTDTGAVVLCEGGGLLRSPTGSSWTSQAAAVPQAVALATAPSGQVLLVRTAAAGCAGLAVVDAARPDTVTGCAATGTVAPAPGTVSLSVVAGAGWLVVGDAVFRSTDSGDTWVAPAS